MSVGQGCGLGLLCGLAWWAEHPDGVKGGDDLAAGTGLDGAWRPGAAGLDVDEGDTRGGEHVQVVLPGRVRLQPGADHRREGDRDL